MVSNYLYPQDTYILALDPMSGLVNEGLSFAFPHRVMQLETMRYNRAKIVFQAMS